MVGTNLPEVPEDCDAMANQMMGYQEPAQQLTLTPTSPTASPRVEADSLGFTKEYHDRFAAYMEGAGKSDSNCTLAWFALLEDFTLEGLNKKLEIMNPPQPQRPEEAFNYADALAMWTPLGNFSSSILMNSRMMTGNPCLVLDSPEIHVPVVEAPKIFISSNTGIQLDKPLVLRGEEEKGTSTVNRMIQWGIGKVLIR